MTPATPINFNDPTATSGTAGYYDTPGFTTAPTPSAPTPVPTPIVHSLLNETGLSGYDNETGRPEPAVNVSFSQTDVFTCCETTCKTQQTANWNVLMQHLGSGSGGMAIALNTVTTINNDCKMGCGMWTKHSSLNWKGGDWPMFLKLQCQKHCM